MHRNQFFVNGKMCQQTGGMARILGGNHLHAVCESPARATRYPANFQLVWLPHIIHPDDSTYSHICFSDNTASADFALADTSKSAIKNPETSFQEGQACLIKNDIACTKLIANIIPAQSPYAKLLSGNIAAAEGDFDRAFAYCCHYRLPLIFRRQSVQVYTQAWHSPTRNSQTSCAQWNNAR